MDALILADGEAPQRADLELAWPGWSASIGLVIAADGGARNATRLGVTIDLWVGDGDSLDADGMAALQASGVPMDRANEDKDESDTELAVRAAIQRGAASVIIVGGLGGSRIDHALANIGLLAMVELAGMDAALLDARSRITLVRAPRADGLPTHRELPGRVGDIVSLLPIGPGVTGVTTHGLRYPLVDEPLPEGPARGLSNVRTSTAAAVTVASGLLLVVESPATLGS
jgi:thiamine pyrophosphokinase